MQITESYENSIEKMPSLIALFHKYKLMDWSCCSREIKLAVHGEKKGQLHRHDASTSREKHNI